MPRQRLFVVPVVAPWSCQRNPTRAPSPRGRDGGVPRNQCFASEMENHAKIYLKILWLGATALECIGAKKGGGGECSVLGCSLAPLCTPYRSTQRVVKRTQYLGVSLTAWSSRSAQSEQRLCHINRQSHLLPLRRSHSPARCRRHCLLPLPVRRRLGEWSLHRWQVACRLLAMPLCTTSCHRRRG
jgi:hypothetical protein